MTRQGHTDSQRNKEKEKVGISVKGDTDPDQMPHGLAPSSLPECKDDQDDGSSTKKLSSSTKIKVRYFYNWRLLLDIWT